MHNPSANYGLFSAVVDGQNRTFSAAVLNTDTTKIDLTLSGSPIIQGVTVKVSYSGNFVASTDLGFLADFSNISVTNNSTVIPTAAELANESIAAAKGLVPATKSVVEATDTNLLTMLNAITGMSATGVTLTLESSNANVAANGAITYTGSGVVGNVIVKINKTDGTEQTVTVAVTVPAHTPTAAELGYTFEILEGVGTITGYTGSETNLVIPESFMVNGISELVDAIGTTSFQGNTTITSLVLPNTLQNINSNAFMNCTYLETVNLGTGVKNIYDSAFRGCTKLASIAIPDSVLGLGLDQRVFYGCTSLNTVTIGAGVTALKKSLFEGCSSLNNVILPSNVTLLSTDTFKDCIGLTSLTINGNVQGSSLGSFSGCNYLTSVTIGNAVTVLGNYLFANFSSLESITIPNNVTNLGQYIFLNCANLSSITIGAGVTGVPNYAFYGCFNLQEIVLPSTVTSIGEMAFGDGQKYETDQEPVIKITLGSGVTIADYLYHNENRNAFRTVYSEVAGTYYYSSGHWTKQS